MSFMNNYQKNSKLGKPIKQVQTRRRLMESSVNEYSYIESEEERESGHADTRHFNFECKNPDTHLGCDLGIDVAG
jgi:hypothetical protein